MTDTPKPKRKRKPEDPAKNAARQDALRIRRSALGMTEVRGIYATEANHAVIKAFAKKLADQS